MATDNSPVEIPSEEDYDQAYRELSAGYDAIESVAWTLKRVVPRFDSKLGFTSADPSRLVTAADIGLLWSFLDGIRLQVDQINGRRRELEKAMHALDICRLERCVASGEAG